MIAGNRAKSLKGLYTVFTYPPNSIMEISLQIGVYLPPDPRGLENLRSMEVAGQEVHQIPQSVAVALRKLTALYLKGGQVGMRESFTCLPPAVSLITSLRSLTINGNKGKLQLDEGGCKTLATLKNLKVLKVGGNVPGKGFVGMNSHTETEKFVRFIVKVARYFPHFDVPGFSN
jgi:hypothetical protein